MLLSKQENINQLNKYRFIKLKLLFKMKAIF